MNMVDAIIDYEAGDLPAAGVLDLFSHLIRTGQAWTLQGSYGRAAMALIEAGYLTREGEVTEAGRALLDGGDV